VNFRFLQQPAAHTPTVYAPRRHKDMLAALYRELGLSPEMKKTLAARAQKATGASVVKIKQVDSMSYAGIIIDHYGGNIVGEISAKVKEICLQKTEIINLYLNLSDPLTGAYAVQFEKLGFFFSGLLPAGFSSGDALILQYLNNVPIDYDAIQVESAIARKLVAYVRKQDPNVK